MPTTTKNLPSATQLPKSEARMESTQRPSVTQSTATMRRYVFQRGSSGAGKARTRYNIPVCSPQSNSMAESYVNTFRRDYESRMDLTDAPTVLAQLAAAFEHFNVVHPHSSLR